MPDFYNAEICPHCDSEHVVPESMKVVSRDNVIKMYCQTCGKPIQVWVTRAVTVVNITKREEGK